VTHIYNMENMGPQGNESVSPIPDEIFGDLIIIIIIIIKPAQTPK